jgi:transcriptional regulator with XRE-family HTH domain
MIVFNKEYFARLLTDAKGSRSINQFGLACDVDPGYLSRLLRGLLDNPPSPAILAKIASHAHNGVNYTDLMHAAGLLAPDEEATTTPINTNIQGLLREMDAFFRLQPNLTDNDKEALIRDMRDYFRFKAEQTRQKK